MSSVSSYEAKTRFTELIRRVRRGERITITVHGVPVAVLSPVETQSTQSIPESISKIKTLRRGRTLGIAIKDIIEEGRL
ncbi:MAG: type II toxin-antitoxin system prevent-host-death family antitoxin [Anaerolineales bacterium]|nr:type II toxin-antitoxin system prevent-host-death family antitoxin [Anaerolineales bacterium]